MFAAPAYDSILCFGDSLTQFGNRPGGYVHLLADAYQRKLDVINRGFSGYNTNQAIELAGYIFSPAKHAGARVRLLAVFFGANDAALQGATQHVPLPRFLSNLRTIIDKAYSSALSTDSPPPALILITPPPIIKGYDVTEVREYEHTRSYAEGIKSLANEYGKGVAVLDAFSLIEKEGQKKGGLDEFFYDGLHLTAAGYQLIFQDLLRTIRAHFPELDPDTLSMPWPDWKEIDQTGDMHAQMVPSREPAAGL